MKVLVTGATGFVAGHCIHELLRYGYQVRATVRDPATARLAYLGDGVEIVGARLGSDDGWADAVAGCDFVWHVASPAPKQAPRRDEEVIRPAVDGTLRVLRAAAASGTVRRVVLTSSIDAVRSGHVDVRPRNESDWSVIERSDAYARSKTLAERAAWDFVAGTPLELVSINPGLVLGPLRRAEANVSLEVLRLLLARELPLVPRLGFAVVDVRDVAAAHRLAMEAPGAAGNRYIVAGENLWLGQIADILRSALPGQRIPSRPMPYWLMWLAGRLDRTVRLALPYVDVPALVSSDKARRELGWSPRPAGESIVEAARSLIDHGIVPARTGSDPSVTTR